MIMVIILAVLAMIVVKALTHSPWGTYTVAFTIPLAIFMGIYIRYLRPGRIGEVSVIGLVMLVFAIISGGWVAESPTWAPWFDYTGVQLTWILGGLRICGCGTAGLAAAGSARLSLHLPENRHHRGAGDWHPDYAPDPDDAGADQVRRWYRPGMDRQPVPVPVYHHRLRRGLRLPCADLLRHHAENVGQRKPRPALSATAAC